ncbi:hypothetical protein Poli38472_003833 [Pythium oligandrum]|uniref:BTB domain-containing protein n=1 Tax=Pythium oligandrum TaxID=41045 RepID=A0A8K1CPK7_PYTOL|nr:hypothetical protein Poli38472_003833 [Pythium oligandrum]|eukprot:TMW66068.1 hypothetical protein Poli38472_003833 [Pythium oligandrum]
MHMRWEPLRVQDAPPTIKNHTATPISRTELLIFGGYDGRRNHNDLYLFNSEAATWTPLTAPRVHGSPPAGRNGHSATLADRKVFVIGGWLGSGPLAADDMHVLDLDAMEWKQPPVLGTPPGPCNMHTADYIPHLRSILLFRGGDGREYLNDLHRLDVDTLVWSRVHASGRLPVPRANHSSALVDESQIVIFGGWDGHKRLNDIHVLDTYTMVWSAVDVQSNTPFGGSLPHPRAGMSFVRHRDHVFLFGGSGPSAQCYNDLHIYDPHDALWLDVATLPEDHQLCATVHALLTDGDDESDQEGRGVALSPHLSNSLDYYSEYEDSPSALSLYEHHNSHANPNDTHSQRHPDQIFVVGHGPGRRAGHTCSLLEDRKLFVFGGSCGNEYLNDMYVLDTDPPPRATITCTTSPTLVLQQALRDFVNNEEFSDISFLVEGRIVYAHKIILTLLSDRFRSMFTGGFREAQQKEIVIPDMRYVVFLKMLEYLYTGDFVDDSIGGASGYSENDTLIEHPGGSKGRRTSSVYEEASDDDVFASRQDGSAVPERFPSLQHSDALGKTQMVDLDVQLDLLIVADEFMLDHLKQLCERSLQYSVTMETVMDVLAAANQANAAQLRAICMHFLRNHDIEWLEEDEEDAEHDQGADTVNECTLDDEGPVGFAQWQDGDSTHEPVMF